MSLEPILVCSDAHRPYHDKRAWKLLIKVGRALRPKHLIVIGDLADMYTVSSHSKSPARAMRLNEEIDDVEVGLDELDDLGASNKIFTGGNHEDRLRRYLEEKAPEIARLRGVTIPELFNLRERGWKYIPYKRHTMLGKMNLTHDVGKAGRAAVFAALDTFQHSVVTGHTHRLQYIVEGNAKGEVKLSAMFGWLGDVEQIDYMHRIKAYKDWALGFGYGYLDTSSKLVYLVPAPIVNYTCCINGKLFRG